jgi:class 3 adenylate cyclase
MLPETKFAKLGDDHVAYQVVGEGPVDLVFVAGMAGHVDVRWEDPFQASFLSRLASFTRLILFDRRGTGASDPVSLEALPSWELWIDDLRCVLDAAESERAAMLAQADAGPMALLFAATEPDRTAALVLANTSAKFIAEDDYPYGLPRESSESVVALSESMWGTEAWVEFAYPSMANDARFRRWFAKYQRVSCSPRQAGAYMRSQQLMDVREVLPTIRVPTLVLHREKLQSIPFEQGRYVADHVPGAKLVTLPGADVGMYSEDADEILDHIEEFLTGMRRGTSTNRVLATVMFTDIVGSTDLAGKLGDARWRELLIAHDALVRAYVDRFRGRVVKTTGDGALVTFEGPGRALRCAFGLRDALRGIGLETRVGLHTGEVELIEGDVGGMTVHIAARILDVAEPEEIVVSRTVKDLVAGSEFEFEDRGVVGLKGVEDPWQLYSAR